jgi:hypothetical protein
MRRVVSMLLASVLAAFGFAVFAGPADAGQQINADGLIKLKGITGFVGDGLIDTDDAIGQRLSTFASPSDKAIFVIRAQNERFQRNRIETWVEYADCDGPSEIRFTYQGDDVTEEMFNGSVEVGRIPPGGHFDVRMKVKVGPGAECFVVLGVYSTKFGGEEDFVIGEVFSTQPGGGM